MLSIGRCLIDRSLRVSTQVNFHDICYYCVTCVNTTMLFFWTNQFAFLVLSTWVVSSQFIFHFISLPDVYQSKNSFCLVHLHKNGKLSEFIIMNHGKLLLLHNDIMQWLTKWHYDTYTMHHNTLFDNYLPLMPQVFSESCDVTVVAMSERCMLMTLLWVLCVCDCYLMGR